MTVLTSDITAAISLPTGSAGVKTVALFRRGSSTQKWKKVGDYGAGSHTIKELTVGRKYEFAAVAVDGDGNLAAAKDWTLSTITPRGNQTAPPAPSGFVVAQDGEYLTAKWVGVKAKMREGDLDYYDLRIGATWANTRRIGKVTDENHRFKWETDGSTTFLLATVDKYGRASSKVSATVSIQALAQFSDGTEIDEDGGGFSGTKTDVEVDSGALRYARWGDPANTITINGEDWTFLSSGPLRGVYETSQTDLGSTRNVRAELALTLTNDAGDIMAQNGEDLLLPPMAPRAEGDGTPIDVEDGDAAISWGRCTGATDDFPLDVRVEIKLDSGSWMPYVPGFYSARYWTFRVYLYSWNRWHRPKLSVLRFKERKRNLKDEGLVGVVGSPGPTPIAFVESFIDTPDIVCNSDAAFFIQVVSVNSTTATVRAFGDDGLEVFTGSIYWIAAGT